jgi:hypothetical protein
MIAMTETFRGLSFEPPAGFTADEAMLSLRAPPPALADPRVLQKQFPIRPNLLVHRRQVGSEADLELLAGEICAELVNSVVGLQALTTERFAFDDGAPGLIIGFDFPAPEAKTARQYQALRTDEGVLTILTLTVDGTRLNDETKRDWLKCLSSARPVPLAHT